MYNLLIVDDEPLVRRGIKDLVNFETLEIGAVYEASNGEKALEIFKTQRIDIILMDINMPKINGLSLAEQIKSIDKNVKIAMITGYDYFDYAVKALRIGVDEYILKPVSRKDIDEILKKLIQSKIKDLKQNAIESYVGQVDFKHSFEEQLKQVVEKEIFDSQFSLTFLSEKLNLTSNYLSSVFKDIYGIAFQDYVTKARIEKAKLLLIASDMKNYEIADAIGFEDVNYFATRFKKYTGMTPKQYKGKVQSNGL
ncbi:MAG: response regulator [Clostridia bacterium]|nr:response regulator [Clostridia bacterium]